MYKKCYLGFCLFFISYNFTFPLMNALFYVKIDQSFHKGKSKVVRNEKRKKTKWLFLYIKYSKLLKHLGETFNQA